MHVAGRRPPTSLWVVALPAWAHGQLCPASRPIRRPRPRVAGPSIARGGCRWRCVTACRSGESTSL